MKKLIFTLVFNLISLSAFACDGKNAIDQVEIQIEKETVPAQVCQQGDEVLVITDRPVAKQHLLYGGLNVGLPYLGLELTYVQKQGHDQIFHISSALEGSLGSSAIAVRGGYHPFGNALFIGGTARGYEGVSPTDKGFEAGPTIGLSGGGKIITGHIGLSYLAGYDSRVGGLTHNPEITMGLRIRLMRLKSK